MIITAKLSLVPSSPLVFLLFCLLSKKKQKYLVDKVIRPFFIALLPKKR